MKTFLTILPIALLVISAISFVCGIIFEQYILLIVGGFCGMYGMVTFIWRVGYSKKKKDS